MAEDPYVTAQQRVQNQLAKAWTGWEDDQLAFLREHTWAVLATGRRDGSPQTSMVNYVIDDDGALLVSAKAYTAKHRNAVRQPKVSVVVPDGRKGLVIYGTTEVIVEEPRRSELTAKVFASATGQAVADPTALIPTLDAQQRSLLRIVPTSAVLAG